MALDLSALAPTLYSQLNFGEYINTASTFDEKRTLSVKSTLKPEGTSSFSVRFDEHRNAVTGSADDHLAVYLVVRGNFRVYQPETVDTYVSSLRSVVSTANLVRLYRGEI